MGYDLIIPGNHDLKHPHVVQWTKDKLVHVWGDRYLTSNIERTEKQDNGDRPPLGARFRDWETPTKKRMMAFGVVTEKTSPPKDSGLEVIPVNKMVERKWFKDALKRNTTKPVDVFVLLGHVDPKKPSEADNLGLVYKAIRQEHPLTPIMIFAGHTHRRWCRTFQGEDGSIRSMLLQSGQYFDTVGWMSVKLDDNSIPRHLKFSRRYLDNNVRTYMYHTGFEREADFKTKSGENITNFIQDLEKSEKLSEVYGWLDLDYFLDRKAWTEDDKNKNSLFNFYLDAVEHTLIDHQKSPNWLFFSNWGIVRGDIYRGPFTVGDLYSISPDANDTSPFLYANVTRDIADQIVQKVQEFDKASGEKKKAAAGPQSETLGFIADDSQSRFSLFSKRSGNFTYGWKTEDLCGNNGDDVRHEKIPKVDFDNTELPVYFWRRNYKSSNLKQSDTVHIIVNKHNGNKFVSKVLAEFGTGFKLESYSIEVNQKNLLENYIKAYFPLKSAPSDKK